MQCSAAQHSTAQHSTAQHSTAQHSTALHCTAGNNAWLSLTVVLFVMQKKCSTGKLSKWTEVSRSYKLHTVSYRPHIHHTALASQHMSHHTMMHAQELYACQHRLCMAFSQRGHGIAFQNRRSPSAICIACQILPMSTVSDASQLSCLNGLEGRQYTSVKPMNMPTDLHMPRLGHLGWLCCAAYVVLSCIHD